MSGKNRSIPIHINNHPSGRTSICHSTGIGDPVKVVHGKGGKIICPNTCSKCPHR
ncbi:MAG: hypothetical protein PHQ95_00875 [Candidatus Gracilibacteria bacterium]|nr:hypothetical protein [Candidatus Gracilibacteria bacterium]